jgi:hypothetical protein
VVIPAREEPADPLLVALVSLLTLSTFLTQFVFRAADDNRLTSWQWVFADADLARMSGFLVAGILVAYALSRVRLPERRALAVLALTSFLAGAVFWREPEVIVDAARYFTQAKHLLIYGIAHFVEGWGREIGAWTDLPLVPGLFGLTFALGGETRVAVQVLTTLLFSGTVVLTYLLGKTLWDGTVGLYAGALLLGMPYLLTQVPLMLVDVPAMFLFMLAVLTVTCALRRGGGRWVASASAAVALAAWSKYSTWLWLTVLPVIVVVHLGREPRLILRRGAVIALAPLLATGVVVFLKHDVISAQLGLLQGYQLPGLRRWQESAASTFLFQIHPFVTAAALYSGVVALRKRDWRYAIIAWVWLPVALLRVERIRYLVPVLPMLALLAGYGLREVRSERIRRFAAACIVVSSLTIGIFGYLPHLMRVSAVNLKEAGEFLDSLPTGAVEVVALPQRRSGINPAVSVPLLDLFTRKSIVYQDGPESPAPTDNIEQSPLRFTWEHRSPGYYGSRASSVREDAAVVVISAGAEESLPESVERKIADRRLARSFQVSDDWFQYQTLVRIYLPVAWAPTGRRG